MGHIEKGGVVATQFSSGKGLEQFKGIPPIDSGNRRQWPRWAKLFAKVTVPVLATAAFAAVKDVKAGPLNIGAKPAAAADISCPALSSPQVIQEGDTWQELSDRYGATPLMNANFANYGTDRSPRGDGLYQGSTLIAGQQFCAPNSGRRGSPDTTVATPPPPPPPGPRRGGPACDDDDILVDTGWTLYGLGQGDRSKMQLIVDENGGGSIEDFVLRAGDCLDWPDGIRRPFQDPSITGVTPPATTQSPRVAQPPRNDDNFNHDTGSIYDEVVDLIDDGTQRERDLLGGVAGTLFRGIRRGLSWIF